jgi:enoyl-CoA hydratase/carnithine racemase
MISVTPAALDDNASLEDEVAEQLRITNDGAVRMIEFCNPPQNYITYVMLRELYGQLLKDRKDDSVRVLVLTGGLEDTFLTHYDVDELIDFRGVSAKKRSDGANRRLARLLSWLFDKADRWPWLDRMAAATVAKRSKGEQSIYYWTRCLQILDSYPKPVIAAINGLALGGGCEISLCCDFRYMADGEYYRIGLPEVLLGITPGGTGTPIRLPRIMGEAKALEVLLTGRIYRPAEAESIGLIHKAVPPAELMPLVMQLARKLARGAPVAQAVILSAVRKGSRLAWPQGRILEMAGALKAMSSDDADAGMRAYVTRIAPQFEGVDLEKRFALYDDLYTGNLTEFEGK